MTPRTDEEVALEVVSRQRGRTQLKPYEALLVAAGRAEGDKQGERRGWIEALTWVLSVGDTQGPVEPEIRARLREIEP